MCQGWEEGGSLDVEVETKETRPVYLHGSFLASHVGLSFLILELRDMGDSLCADIDARLRFDVWFT